MNSPETHDPIDKLLREQDAYVADDGFTKRVVAALPRRRSAFPRIILLAVVAAGAAMAACWMPWANLPPLDYTQVFAPDSKVLSAWLPFIVVGVALVSTALIALRRED
jgi:hypothetical protein